MKQKKRGLALVLSRRDALLFFVWVCTISAGCLIVLLLLHILKVAAVGLTNALRTILSDLFELSV